MLDKSSPGESKSTRQRVAAGAVELEGNLNIPEQAQGIVLLAHGSGNIESGAYYGDVTDALNQAGLATLVVDLLTEEEETLDSQTQFFRFNVSVFSQRIIGMTNWLIENSETNNLAIGYFGSGVSGAAALEAAAERPDAVHAIVAWSARTDLAAGHLERVAAATCFIVGANDTQSEKQNREALAHIPINVEANKKIEAIPGANLLFEEANALQKALELTSQWFHRHLTRVV